MDGTMDKPEGAGEHIWLRYATQFTTGGRTYTIEMGISVPLGASAEARERLIREAEVGMDQLSSHVEGRIAQVLQRNANAQSQSTIPTSTPAPKPSVSTPSRPASRPPITTAPAPSASSSPTSSPVPLPDVAQTQSQSVPPTRQHIGASMPIIPGMPGAANGTMLRPQFIQFIKETLGLTPKQAMELLKVKSLDGVNLREALTQLQHLVVQKPAGREPINSSASDVGARSSASNQPREIGPARPEEETATMPVSTSMDAPSVPPVPSQAPASPEPSSPSVPAPPGLGETTSEAMLPDLGAMREERPSYRFDEEVDLEDAEEGMEGIEDEGEDTEQSLELTEQQRARAQSVLSRVKEARGSTAASPARLTVLRNVIDSQVSEEQLQRLIQSVWAATTLKRLKVDQVEALISWAKEDDFVSEMEAVLAIIEVE